MSLEAFQKALARLVVDPDFRDAVREGGEPAPELTDRERARLGAIAADAGMDITRTLHKGFRYGKIRSLLPLTCTLLGSKRLAAELGPFWRARPCRGFYYIEEALDFCAHLESRMGSDLRCKYLPEVLAYERTVLEIQAPVVGQAAVGEGAEWTVPFEHDPQVLLRRLAIGKRPRGVSVRKCTLVGHADAAGDLHWRIVAGGRPGSSSRSDRSVVTARVPALLEQAW
jgi:hypothetical protein